MPKKDPADERIAAIRKRLASIPTAPGVYRWLDADGEILYVGKAKNLRNRLRSYVAPAAKPDPWKAIMIRQIAEVDVTIVSSELEAFILESNLIKKFKPKYNIMLKDDKGYVYVRLSVQDPYPTVEVVRRLEEDGAKYFGPFLGAYFTNSALDMLDDILKFRACKKSLEALNHPTPASSKVLGTPCLEYQIGKCCGLCIGAVTQEDYRERIGEVERFFRGNFSVKKKAEEKMRAAAANQKFEAAARIRDVLKFIADLESKQIVSDTSGESADVFGIAFRHSKIHVVLLRERDGKVIEQVNFALKGEAENAAEAMAQFLPQYYADTQDIPETVIVRDPLPDQQVFETWLRERRGKAVRIVVPERGKKSKLLEMAEKNADEKVRQQFAAWEADLRKAEDAIESLKELLSLPEIPKRIEGYDISHQGGNETVASMVVFENGKPKSQHYRSFNIRTVKKGNVDDYRSLQEALRRRLLYLTQSVEKEEAAWLERGITFAKSRKAEGESLCERFVDAGPLDYKEFFVARRGDSLAACMRLHVHPGNVVELDCFWAEEELKEEGRIEAFMLRRSCSKTNARKIYLLIDPSEEERYAQLGFRYVITPPEIFAPRISQSRIVTVFDCKEHKIDESFSSMPDLLLIDGGKGQLSSVKQVIDDLKLPVKVISIAKREEEIFTTDSPVPVMIPKEAPAQFLLQRVRDESHRFANDRRKRRAKSEAIRSALDEIPGIGGVLKQKLLAEFGSVDVVKAASDEALLKILNAEQLSSLRQSFGGWDDASQER